MIGRKALAALRWMLLGLPVAALAVTAGASTSAMADDRSDRAIAAVKELCLSGKQFDLKVDAKGNISLIKLTPGAEGSVTVNARESAGAAAILDEKIRQIADEDIRRCISPHVTRILDSILGEGSLKPEVPRAVEVTWNPNYPLQGMPNEIHCTCVDVKRDGMDRMRENPAASVTVNNKCKGDVSLLAAKDNKLIMPPKVDGIENADRAHWFKTTLGRNWAYVTLAPSQTVTLQYGGAWGGGLVVTKCLPPG